MFDFSLIALSSLLRSCVPIGGVSSLCCCPRILNRSKLTGAGEQGSNVGFLTAELNHSRALIFQYRRSSLFLCSCSSNEGAELEPGVQLHAQDCLALSSWVVVYAANPLCKMFFVQKLDPPHRSFQFGPIKKVVVFVFLMKPKAVVCFWGFCATGYLWSFCFLLQVGLLGMDVLAFLLECLLII